MCAPSRLLLPVLAFERVFEVTYDRDVAYHPVEPSARHVWVRATGEHGQPVPGVVVAWQHTPLHNIGGSPWQALVATTPFDDTLVISWFDATRLLELRDPAPTP